MKFNVLFRTSGRAIRYRRISHISQNKGEWLGAITAYDTAGKKHMGKKDTVGKIYFRDTVRFAELINSVLYHGEKILLPENLVPVEREYPSLFGNADKHRDVFMKDVVYHILYSLELETESDYSMPERVMVYDACEYDQQICKLAGSHKGEVMADGYRGRKSRLKKEDVLIPVVTVVLYLGTDHWEGRKQLSELFRIPSIIQRITDLRIPEYGFHLAEADYVNAKDYETDLREFFQALQCRKDKKKLNELCHSERFHNLEPEAVQAIAIHIDRKRLMPKVKMEGIEMCQAFDELMEDMKMEGIKEGERRGRISILRQMLEEGMEESLVLKIAKCTKEELAVAAGR